VVVTGAYHAAVFALAQGSPVVCLSNSPYYDSKFRGLEKLFGNGCRTITLSDPNLAEQLYAAIEESWISSDKVRMPLLNSAAQQIKSARAAYESVRNLLEPKARANPLQPVRAERVL
jgi:polysaccharide pyruvyl transferase WcaK-like protein